MTSHLCNPTETNFAEIVTDHKRLLRIFNSMESIHVNAGFNWKMQQQVCIEDLLIENMTCILAL